MGQTREWLIKDYGLGGARERKNQHEKMLLAGLQIIDKYFCTLVETKGCNHLIGQSRVNRA